MKSATATGNVGVDVIIGCQATGRVHSAKGSASIGEKQPGAVYERIGSRRRRNTSTTVVQGVPLAPGAPIGINNKCGYKLVKDWDFVTTIRNVTVMGQEFFTRYVYGYGTMDHLSDEWTRYTDNGTHSFDQEGLNLTAWLPDGLPLQSGNIQSGMLRSKWTGKYGVFECYMKVPRGAAVFPAFWLNPQDQIWPPEIDAVEIVNYDSNGTRRSFHFLHGAGETALVQARTYLLSTAAGSNQYAYVPGFDYADDYHVFSVEWTPTMLNHLVDGIVVSSRPFTWIHDSGADGGVAHVLLDLAVGGSWPGPPDVNSLPASLSVKYIRVWQK